MTVTKVTDLTIASAYCISSPAGDGIHSWVSAERNNIQEIKWRDLEADKPQSERIYQQLLLCYFYKSVKSGRSVKGILEHGLEGIKAEIQLSDPHCEPEFKYQELSPTVRFDTVKSAKKWCELAALEVLEIMEVAYPAFNSEIIAGVGETIPYPGVMEIDGRKILLTGFGLADVEDLDCRQIWGIKNRTPCLMGMSVNSQYVDTKVPLPEVRLAAISETAWRLLIQQVRKLKNNH
ncbi:MAG: hypothetical protein KME32_27990 [Mojavia pulchra JT2-VF2]|jgi:hypothetical protein|uniref:Uncharacterized protein n=1 Tax=Mojavia pulchra JT2-VF2 TaxID=287848 RepID=A0A951Q404_9NOST|nr:hypothetical protein [Mojavia pulchra JT2-VF2]